MLIKTPVGVGSNLKFTLWSGLCNLYSGCSSAFPAAGLCRRFFFTAIGNRIGTTHSQTRGAVGIVRHNVKHKENN